MFTMKRLMVTFIACMFAIAMFPLSALAHDNVEPEQWYYGPDGWVFYGAPLAYDDVEQGQWYSEAVDYMQQHDIMTGYAGTNTFGVNDVMTRAQLASILWRYSNPESYLNYNQQTAVNETPMPDVENGQWYTGAANWAYANHVITGVTTDSGSYFDPNGTLTFQQLLVILSRVFATDEELSDPTPGRTLAKYFYDGTDTSLWAWEGVSWAVRNGFAVGNDGYLYPHSDVTRSRAAVVLYRILTDTNAMDDTLYETPAYTVRITPNMDVSGIRMVEYNDQYTGSDGLYFGYEMAFAMMPDGFDLFNVGVFSNNWGPQGDYDVYDLGPCSTVPNSHVCVYTASEDGNAAYWAQYVTVK